MTLICLVCGNTVKAHRSGVMGAVIAVHFLNTGAACPGSGAVRSTT
jgi:hypothetical protein